MARYQLGVSTSFAARHYLVGGDFGAEGEVHAHDYRVELVLESDTLDEQGFVCDLVAVEAAMARSRDRYRGAVLNDLPELEGVNPGCEAFARAFAERTASELDAGAVSALTVRVWESDTAWASYRLDLSATLSEGSQT